MKKLWNLIEKPFKKIKIWPLPSRITKKKKEKEERYFASELDILMDKLIRDTIGPKGTMTTEFHDRIAAFDPDNTPIGEEAAKELLVSMLTLAVAQRKLFNSRIEKSVEVGGLFDRYYGKLHTVSELANSANVKRKLMLEAEDQYLRQYSIWKKLMNQTHIIQPDPDYASNKYKQDLHEVLHKTGGKT